MLSKNKIIHQQKPNNCVNNSLCNRANPFVYINSIPRFLLISIILGLIILIWFRDNFYPIAIPYSEWMSLALQVNLLIILIPFIFYKPSYGWFHPLIFYTFFTLIFHLRRSYIYLYGIEYHIAMPGWDSEKLSFLVTYDLVLRAFALIAYYIGFFLSLKLTIPKINFTRPNRFKLKALLIIGVSVLLLLANVQMQGGLKEYLIGWGGGRPETGAAGFYFPALIFLSLITCQIWIVMDPKAHRRPVFWVYLTISIVINFLASASRGLIIFTVINCLIVWMIRDRKFAFTNILIAVLVLSSFFGILGNLRQEISIQGLRTGDIDYGLLAAQGLSSDKSSNDDSSFSKGLNEISERSWLWHSDLPILARVPNEIDFLYGKSYLALLTLPIPRTLFKDPWQKLDPTFGALAGKVFFNADFSIPAEEVGEAYWNFGIPGVLSIFFLFGIFHRWLAETFCYYATEPAAIVLYGMTLFTLRPVTISIFAWLLMLVPMIILLYIMGAISWGNQSMNRK